MAKLMISLLSILGLAGLFGCGKEQDPGTPLPKSPAAAADPNAKPYPLKTCVVSGEELGKMGEPMRFIFKGQEIKFCCKGCDKDFQKEPEKFLQKIAAAAGK
jgi:YHS domain-containing protein